MKIKHAELREIYTHILLFYPPSAHGTTPAFGTPRSREAKHGDGSGFFFFHFLSFIEEKSRVSSFSPFPYTEIGDRMKINGERGYSKDTQQVPDIFLIRLRK